MVLQYDTKDEDIKYETSLLSDAQGSASWSNGISSVLCVVSGPSEVRQRDELFDKAYLDIHFRHLDESNGLEARYLEEKLHKAISCNIFLEQYPRTLLQITVQPLVDDSAAASKPFSLLECTINASLLALLDAGISLKDTFSAFTYTIFPNIYDSNVDISTKESTTNCIYAVSHVREKVTFFEVQGLIQSKELEEASMKNIVKPNWLLAFLIKLYDNVTPNN